MHDPPPLTRTRLLQIAAALTLEDRDDPDRRLAEHDLHHWSDPPWHDPSWHDPDRIDCGFAEGS